jgi:hypothetical protein
MRDSPRDLPGRTYVLNNDRISKRSPSTTVAPLGNTESPVVIAYMIILDIFGFKRRTAYGKGVGGTVMSIAGIVSIRLVALDIDMSAITPCSGLSCIPIDEHWRQRWTMGAYGFVRR